MRERIKYFIGYQTENFIPTNEEKAWAAANGCRLVPTRRRDGKQVCQMIRVETKAVTSTKRLWTRVKKFIGWRE